MIFLITYDTKAGRLLSLQDFAESDRDAAMLALEDAQEAHLSSLNDIEIALFEAPSIETLTKTHSRYFASLAELKLGETTRRT